MKIKKYYSDNNINNNNNNNKNNVEILIEKICCSKPKVKIRESEKIEK